MKKLLIIALSALSLQCCASYGQSVPLPASVPKSIAVSALKAQDLRWQTENWTGSDAPFINAEDQIEASLKAGTSIGALLDSAEAKAIQKPYDAVAQFAWCYVAYKAVTTYKLPDGRNPKFLRIEQSMDSSIQGMFYGTQPHSYVYSRLLFLAKIKFLPDKELITIGHRLIARDPEDDEVRRAIIRLNMDSFYPPRTQEALDDARYLYRKSPGSARFYLLMGDIYYGEFLTHKQQEDADEAIANWHKSFQITAPSKPILEYIQANVKWIHKVESEQANKG